MAQMTQTENIGNVLNQTGLGVAIKKNSKLIISLSIIVFVALAAFLFHRNQQNEKLQNFDQKYLSFQNTTLKDFDAGNINNTQLVEKLEQLLSEDGGLSFGGLVLLDSSKKLMEKGDYQTSATLLEKYIEDFKSRPLTHLLMGTHLSAAYEDLGNYQKALEKLEPTLKHKLLEDKIYFDLGRIYGKLGNSQKAKDSFTHVIENFSESYYANLSRAFLKDIE